MLYFIKSLKKTKSSPKKRIIRKKKPSSLTLISTFVVSFFFRPATAKEKVNPYEPRLCIQYTQKKLLTYSKKIKYVFFVPDEDVKILLLGLIHMSKPKSKIRIAIYQLTDKDIVEALIAAHKRGVILEIITDQSCIHSRYEKITQLRRLGIPVHVYGGKYYSIMHNKFFVFDNTIGGKAVLFTGSANATMGGTTRNEENVWIIENKKIIDQYKNKFDTLKKKIALMPAPKSSEIRFSKKLYRHFVTTVNNLLSLTGIFG